MPTPITSAPQCCDRAMRKNGKPKQRQRWRCPTCGKTFIEGARGHGGRRHGRPNSTSADRSRKLRARRRAEKAQLVEIASKSQSFIKIEWRDRQWWGGDTPLGSAIGNAASKLQAAIQLSQE